MVVVLKPKTPNDEIEKIKRKLEDKSMTVSIIPGKDYDLLNISGETSNAKTEEITSNACVEKVIETQQGYKLASRLLHSDNTLIKVGNKVIGGDELTIIAGPCSVESKEQIIGIAKEVKNCGAGFLRGGAFKPRTSPYSFQGMRFEGLELLKMAREETGLPIVSEIMSTSMVDRFAEDVDIIQVGARNMQNFELLKELGKIDKPVLLKRGLSSTIEELLMSAEYIMSGGNSSVILCERGIRTFETYTRNTLDLSAIPAIKRQSHLPIIVDPSHATGLWWMVEPLAKAAIAVGADGIMVEVHNNPKLAKCDGQQSIKPEGFKTLMDSIAKVAGATRKMI